MVLGFELTTLITFILRIYFLILSPNVFFLEIYSRCYINLLNQQIIWKFILIISYFSEIEKLNIWLNNSM